MAADTKNEAKPKKPSRFAPLIAWVLKLFPVRVFQNYSAAQGPLLASGLAYQAIFAVFAAVWVGFSIIGLVAKILTLAVMFALDTVILGAFFRVLSDVKIPWRRLRSGALVGAAALGILKVAGGSLLGVSKNNPLLATFAVILGLLIFFNFVCQVILISASWIKVGMTDRNLPIDPEAEAARLEQERKDVEAAEAKAAAARPRGLARLFRRKRVGARR
jgi:uncharacterized BrkB/YihY/UPF0761 family membrane protein